MFNLLHWQKDLIKHITNQKYLDINIDVTFRKVTFNTYQWNYSCKYSEKIDGSLRKKMFRPLSLPHLKPGLTSMRGQISSTKCLQTSYTYRRTRIHLCWREGIAGGSPTQAQTKPSQEAHNCAKIQCPLLAFAGMYTGMHNPQPHRHTYYTHTYN